jgi:transcriptional regulator with XRE-family HTH domain
LTILRAYRLLQGKTLMVVSKESGIDIAKLSYAERGIVPLSAVEYSRLSKILNLPSDKKPMKFSRY